MIFLGLILMIPAVWLFPWWGIVATAFALGIFRGGRHLYALQTAFSAGIAWAALAFVKDGQNSGIISKRVAGLFSLPQSEFLFALGFLIAFLTAYLAYNAGATLSRKPTKYSRRFSAR